MGGEGESKVFPFKGLCRFKCEWIYSILSIVNVDLCTSLPLLSLKLFNGLGYFLGKSSLNIQRRVQDFFHQRKIPFLRGQTYFYQGQNCA